MLGFTSTLALALVASRALELVSADCSQLEGCSHLSHRTLQESDPCLYCLVFENGANAGETLNVEGFAFSSACVDECITVEVYATDGSMLDVPPEETEGKWSLVCSTSVTGKGANDMLYIHSDSCLSMVIEAGSTKTFQLVASSCNGTEAVAEGLTGDDGTVPLIERELYSHSQRSCTEGEKERNITENWSNETLLSSQGLTSDGAIPEPKPETNQTAAPSTSFSSAPSSAPTKIPTASAPDFSARLLSCPADASSPLRPSSLNGPIGGNVPLGYLSNFLFYFEGHGTDGSNWQGASKGMAGDVAVDGINSTETGGEVAYQGTIFTNDPTGDIGGWEDTVTNSANGASKSFPEVELLESLSASFHESWAYLTSLPADYTRTMTTLNNMDFMDGTAQVVVIDMDKGSSEAVYVKGDADDLVILRWGHPTYTQEIKLQGGGGVFPHPDGDMTPANFVNTAGTINSSGGGGAPTVSGNWYDGPTVNRDGTGGLIGGGQSFGAGGYFTGFWLTIGDPGKSFENADLSNGIFVGSWFTNNTKFSMTSGTSGNMICP